MSCLPAALFALALTPAADPAPPPAPKWVEQLAGQARKSVVVITVRGRDGKREGLGTGFVVKSDGLIATNLHVIGEGRPITVETADGKRHEVTAVHATDRGLDLALLRVAAKDLPALPLGDSDKLKDGQSVVAMGNPQGLAHSVVGGVVSGKREIDGRDMIQLAIPLEPGNSGGPLLDEEGRVQGLLTMKSIITANLGFAVAINSLKPLLEKPNPVAMDKWLTIGALDPDEWKPLFGANWRQRAGRVLVEGLGTGFGGRSLCLSQREAPEAPYEVGVSVKLDNEGGAAGLAFRADGGDKHYGFYPTAGGLRLTRFDGPDVFAWKILDQKASPHYRPGEWNHLKVRVEKDRFRCFVNGQPVFESDDAEWTAGKVGLAKFRDTRAEFKHFQVGKEVATQGVPAAVSGKVARAVEGLSPRDPFQAELIDKLSADAAGAAALREQAAALEKRAGRLRELAAAVHLKRVQGELVKLLAKPDAEVDLAHAALMVARLDNEEVDVDGYLREVGRMAAKVRAALPKDADESAKVAALNRYLFAERGFHGSRGDYYNRSNSYLNEVIDDREGLPITLSVLYMELARRLGVTVVGVGLPGHFVVRHEPAEGEARIIDVFEGGQFLSREDAEKRVKEMTGAGLKPAMLKAVTKKAIVVRMLTNLIGVAGREQDTAAALRYTECIVALEPESHRDRAARMALRAELGQREAALEDLEWLLEHPSEEIDAEKLRAFRRFLTRPDR